MGLNSLDAENEMSAIKLREDCLPYFNEAPVS